MLSQWNDPDVAEAELLKMLAQKQLVMGFGHAVYTQSDPRNEVIKQWSKNYPWRLTISIYMMYQKELKWL